MRILHTGDWHLGATLGTQSRLDDQFDRIGEITAYIESEGIDLVLVAGDVFEERTMSGLKAIVHRLSMALRRPLELGATIVFVAGNHDRTLVFGLLQSLRTLVAPEHASRVHFVDTPRVLPLDLRDGKAVDLVLLPYPTADRYGLDPSRWPSLDAKHRDLAESVKTAVRQLPLEARRGVPRILCGHLLLSGVHGGRCEREQEEIPIDPDLPPGFAYVGLGHIHKPEMVIADGTVRYAGSLERMDAGEASDAKSVVIVDIEGGKVSTRTLPLHPLAIERISASSAAELEARKAELPDPEGSLVHVQLQLRRDDSLRELLAHARALFPRMYGHDVDHLDAPIELRARQGFIRSSPDETCRAYFDEVLKDDPDRDDLLALLDEVLSRDGGGKRA